MCVNCRKSSDQWRVVSFICFFYYLKTNRIWLSICMNVHRFCVSRLLAFTKFYLHATCRLFLQFSKMHFGFYLVCWLAYLKNRVSVYAWNRKGLNSKERQTNAKHINRIRCAFGLAIRCLTSRPYLLESDWSGNAASIVLLKSNNIVSPMRGFKWYFVEMEFKMLSNRGILLKIDIIWCA